MKKKFAGRVLALLGCVVMVFSLAGCYMPTSVDGLLHWLITGLPPEDETASSSQIASSSSEVEDSSTASAASSSAVEDSSAAQPGEASSAEPPPAEPELEPEPEEAPQPKDFSFLLAHDWDVLEQDGDNLVIYRLQFFADGSMGYGAGWFRSEWAYYFEGTYTVEGDTIACHLTNPSGEVINNVVSIEQEGADAINVYIESGDMMYPAEAGKTMQFKNSEVVDEEAWALLG